MLTLNQTQHQNRRPAWLLEPQPQGMAEQFLYRMGRSVTNSYAQMMFKPDIVWHAPLPQGAKIIAANHPTTTDPFLLTTLVPEQVHILISDTLFKVPAFGRYLRLTGHVPVIAGNGEAVLEEALHLLKAGKTIAIFPEGAISPLNGGVHKPHTGAARLALYSGAPIIPVGIHLDRTRIRLIETEVDGRPEVGTWYIRGPYAMTVGDPLYFRGNAENHPYVREISERIIQRISNLSQESAKRLGNKGESRLGTRKAHPSCTAIVCAYNEESTLAGVLDTLINTPLVDEIIAIDDGSSDKTPLVLEGFANRPKTRIILLPENRGKGHAMAEGIMKAHGEILLFVDADLRNLQTDHVAQILSPLLNEETEMVIGWPIRGHHLLDQLDPFRALSGERALLRRAILPLVDAIRNSGYGVETLINLYYRKQGMRRCYISLHRLVHPIKTEKARPREAIRQYVHEGWQIVCATLHHYPLLVGAWGESIKRIRAHKSVRYYTGLRSQVAGVDE